MRYATLLLVLCLLAWFGSLGASADQPGTAEGIVKTNVCSVTTAGRTSVISAASPLTKTAGSAATTLDAVRLYKSEQQSVGVAVTCTQAVALTVTAYGSIDGTNRTTFSPAVTFSFAPSATVKRLLAPASFPVTPYLILTVGSDATYPVSYTQVFVNAW